jgi:3'(2'), 5'-bisphosphate nucleotidase
MWEPERRTAVEAVRRAARLCRRIRSDLVDAETVAKRDRSPVTVADYAAQAIVARALAEVFPGDALMAEEDAAMLAGPLKEQLLRRLPDMTERQILEAVGGGKGRGGPRGRCWALDPIDGTAGFVRGDQYAVALALIIDGRVELGVLGCPNLGPDGALFAAVRGQGAFVATLEDATERPIRVDDVADPTRATICESVEPDHSDQARSGRVAKLLGITAPPRRVDSQCKYGLVARGEASIYLRPPARAAYREKVWDHAAGWIVVTEAGGRVTDALGQPLDFSAGRNLVGARGVVATNGKLHDRVIEATRRVLSET